MLPSCPIGTRIEVDTLAISGCALGEALASIHAKAASHNGAPDVSNHARLGGEMLVSFDRSAAKQLQAQGVSARLLT